jgi:L-arabinose transport system substrate-binding protein
VQLSRIPASVVALLTVASLAACGSDDEGGAAGGDTVRLAYVQKQGDQQYFVDQASGAKDEAAKLGAEVDIIDVGEDADRAISALDTAIAQQVQGLAIVVPDQRIGPQVIDQARNAEIPLLASDDIIKDGQGKQAPFVGFDGVAMGEKVGEEAGRLFKEAGWDPATTRIISASKQDLSVCLDRVKAAGTAFEQAAGASVPVIELGTDNSVTDAQNKTAATVTANRDVKNWVVYGCNDENVSGVVTALANAGYGPDEVIGVGLGAYLACKDWQAGKETGFKSALFISGEEVGRTAVRTLVESIRSDRPLPPETIAKTEMVGPDNWEQAGVNCV